MYIPPGFGTLFPYLIARNAPLYLHFLERSFDARVLGRTTAPDGRILNARVRIGTTCFMVGEAPENAAPANAGFYLFVEDADLTFAHAVEAGGTPLMAPQDMPYGDRQGGVIDPAGYTWWVSTRFAREPYDDLKV
jgi:PhnB protein